MNECRIVIQEHLENGANYFHNFSLDKHYVEEAVAFMRQEYHSDCIFIIEYSLN